VAVPAGASLVLQLGASLDDGQSEAQQPAGPSLLNLTRSVLIVGEAPAPSSPDQALPSLDLRGLQGAITISPGMTLTFANLELVNHQSGVDYIGMDALGPSSGSFLVWQSVRSRRRAGLPLEWVLDYLLGLPRAPGPPPDASDVSIFNAALPAANGTGGRRATLAAGGTAEPLGAGRLREGRGAHAGREAQQRLRSPLLVRSRGHREARALQQQQPAQPLGGPPQPQFVTLRFNPQVGCRQPPPQHSTACRRPALNLPQHCDEAEYAK
jgi:hypothetical protein